MLSRADEASDADDLARSRMHRYVVEDVAGNVLEPKTLVTRLVTGARIESLERATCHESDELCVFSVLDV